MDIKGCSPSCSQLLATSWILPSRDNTEHTLVRLKGIFLGSPHLGGILWIFTVILCPALSSRHLICLPLGTVGLCHPKRLSWSCQQQGFLLWLRGLGAAGSPLNGEGAMGEWRTGGWWGKGRQWERKREWSQGNAADCKCIYPFSGSSSSEQPLKVGLVTDATWSRSNSLSCWHVSGN